MLECKEFKQVGVFRTIFISYLLQLLIKHCFGNLYFYELNYSFTGGGPSQQKKEDPVSSRIISLIGTSVVGLYNPYDKDSVVPVYADSQTSTATGSGSEYLPGSCNIGQY